MLFERRWGGGATLRSQIRRGHSLVLRPQVVLAGDSRLVPDLGDVSFFHLCGREASWGGGCELSGSGLRLRKQLNVYLFECGGLRMAVTLKVVSL